jgi:hypothetical protein
VLAGKAPLGGVQVIVQHVRDDVDAQATVRLAMARLSMSTA